MRIWVDSQGFYVRPPQERHYAPKSDSAVWFGLPGAAEKDLHLTGTVATSTSDC